jgi:hypothetical protein
VGFGSGPLSHPLLVEAIEDEFVPVLVYNNKEAGDGGGDAERLAQFCEPSWNNPVVRFLDASGADVIPRKDGVWTSDALAARMIAALEAAKREVPAYLRLAHDEFAVAQPRRAVFAMYCFWEGEAKLGARDGVLATRPGFAAATRASGSGTSAGKEAGKEEEVVEVTFDPSRASYEQLVKTALSLECASTIFCADAEQLAIARRLAKEKAILDPVQPRDTPPSDRKHALRASPLWWVPMTPLQQSRTNAALFESQDPSRWLSPRQVAAWRRLDPMEAERLPELGAPAETLDALPAYSRKFADFATGGPGDQ